MFGFSELHLNVADSIGLDGRDAGSGGPDASRLYFNQQSDLNLQHR
jgi:hypothetical protein